MIEREALQDVRKYKKTFIGSLTLREFICISLATVVCVPGFFLFVKILCSKRSGVFYYPFGTSVCFMWMERSLRITI